MDLKGKKCVCYVRAFSESKMIKELTELILYCSSHKGILYDPCIFYDLNSKDSDELRPGLDGVIQLVKHEKIDVVLVYSYHRIYLDFERFEALERLFNENGVEVLAINKEVEMRQNN